MKVYTYACQKHAIGVHVRDVDVVERAALDQVALVKPHFTNCWVKGCQHALVTVRLVEVVPVVG